MVRPRVSRDECTTRPDQWPRVRWLRIVPAMPRWVPDRGHRQARRRRRTPLPGLAGAGPRGVPPRPSPGARRPLVRMRRLPGGVSSQSGCGSRRKDSSSAASSAAGSSSLDRPLADSSSARPTVDVLELLALDDAGLLAAAGHWYVPERKARYLRRNLLVVLGNSGTDPDDLGVASALVAALAHADPLVRGHAVWAARRLGRADLTEGLDATESDPIVREETRGAAMSHLLVTNDFPPKLGGIQSYLWELWRRLAPGEATVLTAPPTTPAPSTRRSLSEQCAPASGSAPDTVVGATDPGVGCRGGSLPRRSRPRTACRAARPPAGPALRGGCARGRGHRPRPAPRGRANSSPRCSVQPAASLPPGATRRLKWRTPSGIPSSRQTLPSCLLAWTWTGSAFCLPTRERGAGPSWLAGRRSSRRLRQPPGAPQGDGRSD